jgi:hypothetical protein
LLDSITCEWRQCEHRPAASEDRLRSVIARSDPMTNIVGQIFHPFSQFSKAQAAKLC